MEVLKGFKTKEELDNYKKSKLKRLYYAKKRELAEQGYREKTKIIEDRFENHSDMLYTTEQFYF